MNELDDLKQALHAPPGYTPRALDLDAVMHAGGRLRRRRQLVAGSAGALAVAVLLVGGSRLIDSEINPVPGTPTAPAAAGPVRPAAPSTKAAEPSTEASEPSSPLGEIIPTGLFAGRNEWVFYGVPVTAPELPDTHFGVMLALKLPDGDLDAVVEINEFDRPDRTPGFHPGEAAQKVDGRNTPAFGYYVGPAHRIVATVHKKRVTAHLAAWSEDPSVKVFWFDPKNVGPGAELTGATAFDRTGKKLPLGSPSFGRG